MWVLDVTRATGCVVRYENPVGKRERPQPMQAHINRKLKFGVRERAGMNIFASFIPYNAFTTIELLVKPLQAHVHNDLFPDH